MLHLGMSQQGIISRIPEVTSFADLVNASNPVAWYDFQDANLSAGLEDRSGNNFDLFAIGAGPTTGVALRTSTTKSADSSVDSNSNYYEDTPDNLDGYVDGATAITVTFSFKYLNTTSSYCEVLGWRDSNATNVLACTTQYPSGSGLTFSAAGNTGIDIGVTAGNADTDAHIYTMRFENSRLDIYRDGVYVIGGNVSSNELYSSSPQFTLAGGYTSIGGSNLDALFDHCHINNYAMNVNDIIELHTAYLAEVLPLNIATTSATAYNATSILIDIPTHSEGDLLVAATSSRNANVNVLAGWIEVYTFDVSSEENISCFYKFASASEPANTTWNITDSGTDSTSMVMASFTGVTAFKHSNHYLNPKEAPSLTGYAGGLYIGLGHACYTNADMSSGITGLSTAGHASETINYSQMVICYKTLLVSGATGVFLPEYVANVSYSGFGGLSFE